MGTTLIRWVDSWAVNPEQPETSRMDWLRCIPFFALHISCLGVLWVGWSWAAVLTAFALYLVRMFAITGFYHRYFSHRTFKTTRPVQFLFALLGGTAVQRGPLWWAAHHRHHHRHSDGPEDRHSPHRHGLWWSHMGWIVSRAHFHTDVKQVPDLARFPELRFLDRFDTLVPLLFAGLVYAWGASLEAIQPSLQTSGEQMLAWGFCVSTVVLFHGTSLINSLAHRLGNRRFQTNDESRNSFVLALITLGEGWHNNHHRFPGAARQGFFWWELDPTYYLLKLLSWMGLIWDVRAVPAAVKAGASGGSLSERSPS